MTESILAIETSSETCSVALLHNGQLSERSSAEPRGHAKNLLPMINALLNDAEIKAADLDVIAVTNGPGAFTSIRIGVAVCQGLAAAVKCPVISVSSLAVLAYGAMKESSTSSAVVALDARMNEVYLGIYGLDDNGLPSAIVSDTVCSPTNIVVADPLQSQNPVAAGMGWLAYEQEMKTSFSSVNYTSVDLPFPRAADLLDIARHEYRQGNTHDVAELVPIYLRDQVVHS